MARYKMIGTKRPFDKHFSHIEVTTSKKLPGRRVYVHVPNGGKTIGFWSYDNKGIVYQYPGGMKNAWCFFPVLKYQRLKWNKNPDLWGKTSRYIPGMGKFQLDMNKAIHTEILVCQDLETKFKHLNVIRLPHSGIYAEGSDVILTDQDIEAGDVSDGKYKADVKRKVDNSMIGIEVIGLSHRPSGKYRFTYPAHKDFIAYRHDLVDRGVFPVLAWVEPGERVFYMPLWSDDDIKFVFWTMRDYKKYGYRQRKSYAPWENTVDLKRDIAGFYEDMRSIGRVR